MTILERISTIARANINELIDRAEDPEIVIKQLLMDMHNQLLEARTQVAAAIADETRLRERYTHTQVEADEWQAKAELAVEHGDDDLARRALTRKTALQQAAEDYKGQYDAQAKQVEALKDALGQLESKIEEAETRKNLLIARSRRATAETEIRKTLSGLDESTALANFGRMEEKIEQQEARVAALGEVEADGVEERFKELETSDEVERQLAALKASKALPTSA